MQVSETLLFFVYLDGLQQNDDHQIHAGGAYKGCITISDLGFTIIVIV